MIPEATIKALARAQGVDPAVVDRDHALSVVLWAMDSQRALQGWIFKGGTCLRKCHFGDYRFSEDLDFTVAGRLDVVGAQAAVSFCALTAASQGVRLLPDEMRVEVMNDDYGRESIEIKIPYRGVLRIGSAQNVQFHLSADEELALQAQDRRADIAATCAHAAGTAEAVHVAGHAVRTLHATAAERRVVEAGAVTAGVVGGVL